MANKLDVFTYIPATIENTISGITACELTENIFQLVRRAKFEANESGQSHAIWCGSGKIAQCWPDTDKRPSWIKEEYRLEYMKLRQH